VVVVKKRFEFDGKEVWFRQASGMERLAIEKVQAKVFRECRHFGNNPLEWSEEQQIEFSDKLDEYGAGVEEQISQWLPISCMTEGFDINTLTSIELRKVLSFVRGDEEDGAVPLGD
tara:strand:+ start:5807 stop:6154 length:348 start_codon:yes stop_codon:yes gene_type:complete